VKDEDYPSLYQMANEVAARAQRHFFLALGAHLITLVIAAIFSVFSLPNWWVAALQVGALLCALGCSIYLFAIKPDKRWYLGRAVAESIKTIAWRYMSRAEPFQGDDASARAALRGRIRVVGEQNRDIFRTPAVGLGSPIITPAMESARTQDLDRRKDLYVTSRIQDQLDWYAKKAKQNRNLGAVFFWILIGVNAVAVAFSVLRVAFPVQPFWPTDIFVAAAASLLTWIQAKRFSDLAGSYSLTAYEIGLIREQVADQDSEAKFSVFVGDAENAFSREHTLWVARRDI